MHTGRNHHTGLSKFPCLHLICYHLLVFVAHVTFSCSDHPCFSSWYHNSCLTPSSARKIHLQCLLPADRGFPFLL